MATYVRPDITTLSKRDLRRLREGIAKMQSYAFTDNRGFLYWSGRHGFPTYDCPHHTPDFLTWHRAYILAFERALQDAMDDATFGLPYWDWTRGGELPEAFADATYRVSGEDQPNPLYSTRILVGSEDRWTSRGSNPPTHPWLVHAMDRATAAQQESSFEGSPFGAGFQAVVESGHDAIHGWVSGDMGSVAFSAYDPLFWFHHCNVDRLWAVWQDAHVDATYSARVRNAPLTGFTSIGADMIDFRALGYEYVVARSETEVTETFGSLQAGQCFTTRIPVPSHFDGSSLLLRHVRPPGQTLEVRVFLDDEYADAQTPIEDNPKLASRRVLFGHASCTGSDPVHCDWRRPRDPKDPRGPHHRLPFDASFPIPTETLRRARGSRKSVHVTVVLVDENGDLVPADKLAFERVDLLTR
ncbi:MAG: tyrosinase family protein [Myxococcota bacterium]